jgi:hypothetical protein
VVLGICSLKWRPGWQLAHCTATIASASCLILRLAYRLERIIAETSNKEGPHLDVSENNPEGVYFTSHK